MAKLGYHWDDVDEVVRPMAQQGKAPLASMGIDAPLACLSKKTRSLDRRPKIHARRYLSPGRRV